MSEVLSKIGEFFKSSINRRLVYLAVLVIIALVDFASMGLTRRTFVFYAMRDSFPVVEERFINRSGNRETDVRRYVEQVLLGPQAHDSKLLFYRDTQLLSLIYQDGVVFASLSNQAALPPPQGGSAFTSLLTLNKGIRRNFSSVSDVRIFIGGNQVFFEEFRRIFEDPADNSRT
ncbi:MAG: hypothetical protein LBG93_02135 [Treponema sp.]|jgi:hypothetical protein|nr:hypothetical protein [Treponema sp.]